MEHCGANVGLVGRGGVRTGIGKYLDFFLSSLSYLDRDYNAYWATK